jgi:acetyltransferase-like isoleucine patch superfamily enzyme
MEILAVNFRNSSTSTLATVPSCETVFLSPLAEVINSKFTGHNHIGMYSTINRSEIGSYSNLGVSSYVSDTSIGRYSLIGSRVSIGGFGHPLNYLSIGAFQWGQNLRHWGFPEELSNKFDSRLRPATKNTVIGSDCWVGDNSVLIAGIKIGNGAVIGAGSVVTKDVPPFAIMAGNPATLIRFRFNKHLIESLESKKWWDKELLELVGVDFMNPESY